MLTRTGRTPWLLAFLALACLAAADARAQQEAKKPRDEKKSGIEQIDIYGRKDRTSTLPTRTPVAVFGGDRSVLDTPRSVNVISELQLRDAAVTRILDLPRVSSSTYAPNTFGYASVPTIRGQEGELFVNGMRRGAGNNGYGFPVSFNPYETIAVVKGPATVVYGPTQRVGGYLDLVTKKPSEEWTGSVSTQYGQFQTRTWGVDVGGPLAPGGELGVRVSYQGQHAGSFYNFVEEDYHDLYAAARWEPSDRLSFDLNGEYYHVDYSDNAGFNRVTQQLIDDGIYITGAATRPDPNSLRQIITPSGTTKLSRSHVFTDPDDKSRAELFSGQLVADYALSDRTNLVNRTLFQSLDKETINNNSFREILKDNYIAENRTELQMNFEGGVGGSWQNRVITGIDLRWNHALGYSQFNTEADNPVDLTAPVETRRIPPSDPAIVNGGFVGEPGRPNILLSPGANYGGQFFGNGDTNDSDQYQYGLFYQHDVRFNEQWGLLIGLRGDIVHIKSEDPLPPPGFSSASDRITLGQGAANASLSFRPVASTLFYVTYSFSQSSPTALGGGFPLGGDNNTLQRERFRTDSQLYEAGAKWSGLDNQLFTGFSVFRQTRTDRNRNGSNSGIISEGAEVEATYQPNANFYVTANGSYIDQRLDDALAFQGTEKIEDAFNNLRPDIIQGTGVGSPSLATFGPASFRYAGLPRYLGSILASYTFDSGLGASLNYVGMSEQNLDILGRTKIRDQFTLNAAIFWRRRNYEFRLDVYNLTDEENFSGLFRNGFFGADLVMPEPPRTAIASVKLLF